MNAPFFQDSFNRLVDSPNQSQLWWHSLPLPTGDRINGHHQDKDLQFKMWQAMQIPNKDGLAGKRVLDIGANDGFFTVAALMAGAEEVTAIDAQWATWPQNILYATHIWNVSPEIVTADFRTYDFRHQYDVIFLLGVLYHLQDVFSCMTKLTELLTTSGIIYLETQMSQVQSDLPIFEYASDIYPTIAHQDKRFLGGIGISNYLFPNEHAILNLAYSHDFRCRALDGPHNLFSKENPTRQFYKFLK